ncbi:MAG: hypothetical protein ACOYMM_11735 [Phycisphaerales bacterium]|jgi:hypothetical protein
MITHSPLKLIVIGSLGVALGSACSFYLWLTPPPTLAVTDLNEVSGRITQLAVRERNTQLRIWLEDGEEPFCSTGPYPFEFPPEGLDLLRVGAMATITFEKSELESPRRNRSEGFSWREIASLSVDGAPVLTLDASNRWIVGNRRMGRVVIPILALFGAILVGAGLRARAKAGEARRTE